MIWSVVKKELRGYFNSAVAVIFLAAFLAVTLYLFFWHDKFFARGMADLRPLFHWMPLVMIILVSALAMRLWADERRGGTLEVLLTLPIPRWQLVLGKFVAGMLLIAIALGLTLELPISIAHLGNLDLGPVFGGYLATLLLSAAYLAIGMCVSAATDNQLVAFGGTAMLCSLMYAVGELGGPIGRAIGSGARFESVARGVLDLRDLGYYAGVVAVGVAVNVLLLQRLGWSKGPRTRSRRMGALLAVALVAANAIALDVWLSPVRRARLDLTQDGTYSLSSTTEKILGGLDQPLLIRGYFSSKTHPKLAPLIPQIRDTLEEYRIAGHGKVRVELVDPSDSDAAKREAKDQFGIDPTPLRFATQSEKSVINAYFAIAIQYGDQHAVLGLDDLIAVRVLDIGDVDITLKNLEYQLTRTIKKTVSEFSSVDALFASTSGKVKLTAYITPTTLPDNWKDAPKKLHAAVDELKKQAAGKLEYTEVSPQGDDQIRDLYQKFGLRPYQDLLSGDVYYFHLLLQVGDRIVRIVPPQDLGKADLKNALIDGLKRAAPGFTRVVGLWEPPPAPPMPGMEGMPPQQMPPPQTFHTLRRALEGSYEVRDVTLQAPVPDDVEALVLAGPANLTRDQVQNLDQFVMRGGSVVALAGRYRLAPAAGLAVEKVTTGLEDEFKKWGITIGDDMVLDTRSDTFPVPENRDLGNGMVVREIHQIAYPYFVKFAGDGLSEDSIITSGLPDAVLHWGSPVTADAKVGDDTHRVDVLLRSSKGSWLSAVTSVEPDLEKYPDLGFPGPKGLPGDKKGSQVMAVAVTGGFASGFAKPAEKGKAGAGSGAGSGSADKGLLAHSPPDARIVVFGSSAFVSDDVLGLAQQLDSDLATTNLELVHNAVDWTLADTDLLAIRAHDSSRHVLTVDASTCEEWRDIDLVAAFLALIAVVAVAIGTRRSVEPVTVKEV